jgi:ATP-dependent Lon protease
MERASAATKDLHDSSSPFWARFPWSARHTIRVDEFHKAFAVEILSGIEDILGDHIESLGFLRIVTVDHKLKVYVSTRKDFDWDWGHADGGVGKALGDMVKAVQARSDRVAAVTSTAGRTDAEAIALGENASSVRHEPSVEVIPQNSLDALNCLAASGDRKDSDKRIQELASRLADPLLCSKKLATVADLKSLAGFPCGQFPNFAELFEFLRGQFSLAMIGDQVFRLPPILLVGEPGIGKTEVIMRLATLVRTNFVVQNMASSQTNASLAGSDIYWSNSRHGAVFEALAFGRTANPIVFLDEIDKILTTQYDPLGALYGLLERKTAATFVDRALPGVSIDASHTVWFAAANDERPIDEAILSRFKVFHIPTPTKEQMPTVVRSIYQDLRSREQWGNAFEAELADEVITTFCGRMPREVQQMMQAACANAAMDGRTSIVVADVVGGAKTTKPGFLP